MRHWENFECEFSTWNRTDSGNSEYYVWKDFAAKKGIGDARIKRTRKQSTHPHVAYMNPGDMRRFAETEHSHGITVIGVLDASITVMSARMHDNRPEIFILTKFPRLGWHPFDFALSHGKIVDEHIGDPITKLKPGPPPVPRPPKRRTAALNSCSIM
jgi:hypothetical protein